MTVFDDLDKHYRHAKFGEDRTMSAGCRCENMVFVTVFLSVMHAPSPEHRAFIVRTRNKIIVPSRTVHTGMSNHYTKKGVHYYANNYHAYHSRLFPANSASDCLRFLKFFPQFCESCGAI